MPTGWVGEVDVSSFDFSKGSQVIFKGDFVKGEWSGNLSSFPVDGQGTILFDAENWAAGDILDDQNYDSGRNIVTMKGDGSKIPFRWASLDTTQRSKLDSDVTKGTNIVNFLRGDRTNEKPNGANLYRPRAHVLGDIIHSRPLFVGDTTNPRVYVGANDGMLHSFDADTGVEVFAYVPSFFISPIATTSFSHIKTLTVEPYVHNYFVDASPNARKVTISGGNKTILVGGVGAGGKGLYALDITDPTAALRSGRREQDPVGDHADDDQQRRQHVVRGSWPHVRHSGDRQAQRRHLGGDRRQRLQRHRRLTRRSSTSST